MLFSFLAHRHACMFKQNERQERIRNLAPRYHEPLTVTDIRMLNRSIAELVAGVRAGRIEPGDILTAYAKKALKAHAENNCLTEIMISAAESWARDCNRQGPLADVPISLKDVSDWRTESSCPFLDILVIDCWPCGIRLVYWVLRMGRKTDTKRLSSCMPPQRCGRHTVCKDQCSCYIAVVRIILRHFWKDDQSAQENTLTWGILRRRSCPSCLWRFADRTWHRRRWIRSYSCALLWRVQYQVLCWSLP